MHVSKLVPTLDRIVCLPGYDALQDFPAVE